MRVEQPEFAQSALSLGTEPNAPRHLETERVGQECVAGGRRDGSIKDPRHVGARLGASHPEATLQRASFVAGMLKVVRD